MPLNVALNPHLMLRDAASKLVEEWEREASRDRCLLSADPLRSPRLAKVPSVGTASARHDGTGPAPPRYVGSFLLVTIAIRWPPGSLDCLLITYTVYIDRMAMSIQSNCGEFSLSDTPVERGNLDPNGRLCDLVQRKKTHPDPFPVDVNLRHDDGWVAERLKAPVLKTGRG